MRRWGFTAAAAIIALTCVVLPFLHLREVDTYGPLGFRTQVWVRGSTPQADAEGLGKSVASFAHRNRVNVARSQAATDNAFFGRDLYIAVGDPEADVVHWLDDGYPYFSRAAETAVHRWEELHFDEIDPRGFYLVDAPLDTAERLAETFSDHGFVAEAHPYLGPVVHAEGMLKGGRGQAAAIAMLSALVLIGATVLMSAKTYGVGRLHGHGFTWMLKRDLIGAAPPVGSAVSVVAACATIGLAAYNQLHHFGTYAALVATLFAVSSGCAFAAHAAAVWLTTRTGVIAAVKGLIPERATLAAAYLLRLPTALLAISSIVMAVSLTAPTQRATEALDAAHEHAGDSSYVLLNGSLGDSGAPLMASAAQWFERADRHGRIVLAKDNSRAYATVAGDPEVLTVNPTYLGKQPVLAADGRRVLPDRLPRDRPTLLVPENLSDQANAVADRAAEQLEFARQLADADPVPALSTVEIAAGQRLFTYGSALGETKAFLTNPFVLIVPPELTVWGPMYIDMAEDIVLLEPGLPADVRNDPRLSTVVLATLPVLQKMANDARAAQLKWLNSLVNATVSILLLLAVVAATVAVYARGSAIRLFVRFVHGWSRLQANPVLVIAETVVLILLLGYGSLPWIQAMSQPPVDPAIPPPPSHDLVTPGIRLGATAVVAVVGAMTAAIVLRLRERRIITDKATDRM